MRQGIMHFDDLAWADGLAQEGSSFDAQNSASPLGQLSVGPWAKAALT